MLAAVTPIDMTMESYRHIMDLVGTSVDGIGVFVIIGGALVAIRDPNLSTKRSFPDGVSLESSRRLSAKNAC